MAMLKIAVFLIGAYLIGAIPFGYLFVWIKKGQDIRELHSGRTGATNTMRAAGFWPGLSTSMLDILKAASTVWLARSLFPAITWIHVLAPVVAIVGHNYSVYMIQRRENGEIKIGGGAGGAPCLGGSLGLWTPSGLITLAIGAVIFYFVGYASIATISVAVISIVIFSIRAFLGLSPWVYVGYGVLSELLLLWALRPNIKRLMDGTERLHGFRARQKKS